MSGRATLRKAMGSHCKATRDAGLRVEVAEALWEVLEERACSPVWCMCMPEEQLPMGERAHGRLKA